MASVIILEIWTPDRDNGTGWHNEREKNSSSKKKKYIIQCGTGQHHETRVLLAGARSLI